MGRHPAGGRNSDPAVQSRFKRSSHSDAVDANGSGAVDAVVRSGAVDTSGSVAGDAVGCSGAIDAIGSGTVDAVERSGAVDAKRSGAIDAVGSAAIYTIRGSAASGNPVDAILPRGPVDARGTCRRCGSVDAIGRSAARNSRP
jgi:hypothetical protein